MFFNKKAIFYNTFLFLLFVSPSCSYKAQVQQVYKKHGVNELPIPSCKVAFYYGDQKVASFSELQQKLNSANTGNQRKNKMEALAIDANGKMLYQVHKNNQGARPIMSIELQLPQSLLKGDLEALRKYKGFRLVSSIENFRLYNKEGLEYFKLSSIIDTQSYRYSSK